jgi:hypothetical protein
MYRSLTAIALCMVAQGSIAQCADSVVEQLPPPVAELKHPAGNAPSQTNPRHGSEFIAVAAASTRDDAPTPRATASQRDEQHPRRGGIAMLLAALALMSGIALRRFGAPGS